MVLEIERILDNIAKNTYRDANVYIANDGMKHCAFCDGAREMIIEFNGKKKMVPIVCECLNEKFEKEREEAKQRERSKRIMANQKACFQSSDLIDSTFANDDSPDSKLSQAMKRYVESFPKLKKDGTGLILYGGVGSGKTFYAACIVNALLEKEYACLVTNFSRIVNELQGTWDKDEFLDSLTDFDLVCIDDFGVERDTSFMAESVTTIIDAFYRARTPMIITTNHSPKKLTQESDLKTSRVYSRILERCHPIAVTGEDRRFRKGRKQFNEMQELLGL